MAQHSFNKEVAMRVGVIPAIIYNNLKFWCEHNKANETNYYDGLYWTYNSIKAYKELFPYLSEKQIRDALTILETSGFIKTGNYNKASFDHTKWYADLCLEEFCDEGKSICPTGQIEVTHRSNGIDPQGRAIPNINTDNKTTDVNTDSGAKPAKRFSPPSLDEVSAYCLERGNTVDPQRFIDFYESKGWKVGNTKMKDWKAAVRTWENRDKKATSSTTNNNINPFTQLKSEKGW